MKILLDYELGVSIDAIRICDEWFLNDIAYQEPDGIEKHLTRCFPEEMAEICRQGLSKKIPQIQYFFDEYRRDEQKPIEYALKLLGQFGNSADLILLRKYAKDPKLGEIAIASIQSLEEKTIL